MMSLPLLQIEDLTIDFTTETGVFTAVKHLSLTINRGEIVALVGESGSGKSVTALSVLQLLSSSQTRYSAGKILFSDDGVSQIDLLQLDQKNLQSLRGNKIAMIFQEPMTSLNPVFTCGDQVMEAIMLHEKVSASEAKQRTIKLFARVHLPEPENIFHRFPHQLSGGQKQRVMIAMAVSCRPSLLICDEPTTALDVTVQKSILQLIKELQHTESMGVIFITHDLGVVAEIAERAAVMYRGSIVEEGPVEKILRNPGNAYTKGLLACRPALHRKGERLPVVSDFLKDDKQVDEARISPQRATEIERTTESLIEVKDLHVWYPAKRSLFGKPKEFIKAVNGVSFNVHKGETVGLVGESGSGKSTLGRALLRLIEPTSGSIVYNGRELVNVASSELRHFRKNIQIVFQDPYSSLNPKLTIGDAIAEPLAVHHLVPNARERKEKVRELLSRVNLQPEHMNRYPHEFSGGQRQRIVIARALALEPQFIVWDESVSALDVSIQAQILNLLSDLKSEFGFTSVFISHDLSVIRYISDRVMVMHKGQLVEFGEAEEVYHNPRHEYTKRLLDSIPGIGA
jgi:peptide/nickel transport system ATP-binding protein